MLYRSYEENNIRRITSKIKYNITGWNEKKKKKNDDTPI